MPVHALAWVDRETLLRNGSALFLELMHQLGYRYINTGCAITLGHTDDRTAPTHSHSWESARKGMAPSFSMVNICLSLPKMYEKIDDLKKFLARHVSEKTSIDLPELMTQLAMDFICAGKSSKIIQYFV